MFQSHPIVDAANAGTKVTASITKKNGQGYYVLNFELLHFFLLLSRKISFSSENRFSGQEIVLSNE